MLCLSESQKITLIKCQAKEEKEAVEMIAKAV